MKKIKETKQNNLINTYEVFYESNLMELLDFLKDNKDAFITFHTPLLDKVDYIIHYEKTDVNTSIDITSINIYVK